jgi:hypothetical protein
VVNGIKPFFGHKDGLLDSIPQIRPRFSGIPAATRLPLNNQVASATEPNRFWMRVGPVSAPTLQQNSVRSSNAHD